MPGQYFGRDLLFGRSVVAGRTAEWALRIKMSQCPLQKPGMRHPGALSGFHDTLKCLLVASVKARFLSFFESFLQPWAIGNAEAEPGVTNTLDFAGSNNCCTLFDQVTNLQKFSDC